MSVIFIRSSSSRGNQASTGCFVGIFKATIGRVDPEDDIGGVVYSVLRELETFFRGQALSDIAKGDDTTDNLAVLADWGCGVLDWEAGAVLAPEDLIGDDARLPIPLVIYMEHCSRGISEPLA